MKGNGKKKKNVKKPQKKKVSDFRDIPLPKTLPEDLKPYDTNNDGVLSERERLKMNMLKKRKSFKQEIRKESLEKVKGNKRGK